jgi:pimeloyl-ACP methyl ester carboxylesterase
VALPQLSSYSELLEAIRGKLPSTGRFAILGESFSGPLAVAVAREEPKRVVGVILCNTFVSPPLTAALRVFPWSLLFLLRPPRWAIRLIFTGRTASSDLVSTVGAAVAKTPRRVLAERMRAVFSLPGPTELSPIVPPVLCLSGTDDLLVSLNTRAFDRLSSRVVYERIAAPHLLLQVAPAEAWAAISVFLAQALLL